MDHPFHLHGFSMTPLGDKIFNKDDPNIIIDLPYGYAEVKDSVHIPTGRSYFFLTRIDERIIPFVSPIGGEKGRWLFHCHVFQHAQAGMISELTIC